MTANDRRTGLVRKIATWIVPSHLFSCQYDSRFGRPSTHERNTCVVKLLRRNDSILRQEFCSSVSVDLGGTVDRLAAGTSLSRIPLTNDAD